MTSEASCALGLVLTQNYVPKSFAWRKPVLRQICPFACRSSRSSRETAGCEGVRDAGPLLEWKGMSAAPFMRVEAENGSIETNIGCSWYLWSRGRTHLSRPHDRYTQHKSLRPVFGLSNSTLLTTEQSRRRSVHHLPYLSSIQRRAS